MLANAGCHRRLAPLADPRIGLALTTTFLFVSAAFTIYTYFSVVFGRAFGCNPTYWPACSLFGAQRARSRTSLLAG